MLVVVAGHRLASGHTVAHQAMAPFRQLLRPALQHLDAGKVEVLDRAFNPSKQVLRICADEEVLMCDDRAATRERAAVGESDPEELALLPAIQHRPDHWPAPLRRSRSSSGLAPGTSHPNMLPMSMASICRGVGTDRAARSGRWLSISSGQAGSPAHHAGSG